MKNNIGIEIMFILSITVPICIISIIITGASVVQFYGFDYENGSVFNKRITISLVAGAIYVYVYYYKHIIETKISKNYKIKSFSLIVLVKYISMMFLAPAIDLLIIRILLGEPIMSMFIFFQAAASEKMFVMTASFLGTLYLFMSTLNKREENSEDSMS